jgi:hypothetical protein
MCVLQSTWREEFHRPWTRRGLRLSCRESRPVRECKGSKAKSIFDLELGEYRRQVVPHRGLSDPELLRDFFILQTAANQWYELSLPPGKLLDTLLCVRVGRRKFAAGRGRFRG